MAAIFALILIPAIAAVGFMVKSNSGGSFGAWLAVIGFVMLAGGVVAGLFKLVQSWEDEVDA